MNKDMKLNKTEMEYIVNRIEIEYPFIKFGKPTTDESFDDYLNYQATDEKYAITIEPELIWIIDKWYVYENIHDYLWNTGEATIERLVDEIIQIFLNKDLKNSEWKSHLRNQKLETLGI